MQDFFTSDSNSMEGADLRAMLEGLQDSLRKPKRKGKKKGRRTWELNQKIAKLEKRLKKKSKKSKKAKNKKKHKRTTPFNGIAATVAPILVTRVFDLLEVYAKGGGKNV